MYKSINMDQPGKVANPACGQLNRENDKMNISLSSFALENLVSRDGFGSPFPPQPVHLQLRLNLVLTYGIPPDFHGGVHLSI